MHELYEIRKSQALLQHKNPTIHTKVEAIGLTSEIFGKTAKGRFLTAAWNIMTGGKAKAYIVRDSEGRIIHSSCVMPKCYKFPFLGKKDVEIGPSVTEETHRGQGIFPYVLSQIVKNELDDYSAAYGIIRKTNTASIRGVTKVGFTAVGEMKKTRGGRHIVARRYCEEPNK